MQAVATVSDAEGRCAGTRSAKVAGILYYVAIGKSPHGMESTQAANGRAGGKLQPTATVLNFEKFSRRSRTGLRGRAARRPDPQTRKRRRGRRPVGLGRCTRSRRQGNANLDVYRFEHYEMEIAAVERRREKSLNKSCSTKSPAIQHRPLGRRGSDTKKPYGKWSCHEQAIKGWHINVGPSQRSQASSSTQRGEDENDREAYTEPERTSADHRRQRSPPNRGLPKAENRTEREWDMAQGGVTRDGNNVKAKSSPPVRSRFVPDRIDAQIGDTYRACHQHRAERRHDHGFAVNEHT